VNKDKLEPPHCWSISHFRYQWQTKEAVPPCKPNHFRLKLPPHRQDFSKSRNKQCLLDDPMFDECRTRPRLNNTILLSPVLVFQIEHLIEQYKVTSQKKNEKSSFDVI